MKRCAGVPPSSPPTSNSAVYCVKFAPMAGPACTTAEQALHTRQGGADKSVGSQQQVIGLLRTTRLAKVMHETSSFEVLDDKAS